MIEYEKKLLLTKDEYIYLSKLCDRSAQLKCQTNYYFDTDDMEMNRKNVTCRIRVSGEKYVGTIKKHITGSDISFESDIEVYNDLHDNAFVDFGLSLQGQLCTCRGVILEEPGCKAVLDKNDYLGRTDYELEIEYHPECEDKAFSFLRHCFEVIRCFEPSLEYNELLSRLDGAENKSRRFFKAMRAEGK